MLPSYVVREGSYSGRAVAKNIGITCDKNIGFILLIMGKFCTIITHCIRC